MSWCGCRSAGCVSCLDDEHRRNFTLKSGGESSGVDRQDLVSGGHDDRRAEGASIEAPKAPSGVRYGEGCPLPRWLGGLGASWSTPAGSRGGAAAAIAFSACFRSQHASGIERKIRACPNSKVKNHHFQKRWWQVATVTYKVAPTTTNWRMRCASAMLSMVAFTWPTERDSTSNLHNVTSVKRDIFTVG